VAAIAEQQSGVVSRAQLERCGLTEAAIFRWAANGRLHRIHPGVYAVGHRALDIRGRLVSALLYAGPHAALSHQTAAWWWRLLDAEPRRIHISAPGDRSSLPGVRIHHPRRVDGVEHRGLPVTTVARTLLDCAATGLRAEVNGLAFATRT
jgi:predicted transcriptional regulator of viral defense system